MNKLNFFKEKLPDFFRYFYQNEMDKSKLYKFTTNDVEELYNKVHTEYTPVFVLSPGRSGTKYLSNLLTHYNECRVYHTGSPEFTWYNNFAYQRKNQKNILKLIVDPARYEEIRNCYILQKNYVETNHRITFFAYALSELYPNSKFIELKRDPFKFVSSGVARNWYSNTNIRDEGRIKLKNKVEWRKKNQIEKIFFQWDETHNYIGSFLKNINKKRYLRILSEDMFSNEDVRKEILKFILQKKYIYKKIKLGKINQTDKKKKLSKEKTTDLNKQIDKLLKLKKH